MQIKSVLILSIFLIFNSKSIVANNFTLQLLHFSDIDGNDASILENVENFSVLVNSFKNNPVYGPSTLLVSSGDNLKPGPRFYAAKEKIVQKITGSNEPGHGDIAILNELGIQASGLGIQDFAAGVENLQNAIEADGASTARFPHLAVNINFSNEKDFQIGRNGDFVDELHGKVAGYSVASVNNQLIGLIGVVDPYLQELVDMGNLVVQPRIPADTEN